ncbi:hypothetical protein NM208_g13585 [Fusarium decemcellulare]|uniref:Uncharacterized protein n=1 Tax=Fusarium decemcellulare TaxID=57161 RepID=A0ACC1RL29_9HYPO|nr:hypothetical protein NM208_g13585 [Fusarium decemcellulare]
MTIATTTASGGIGKTSARDCTAVALTEVRMMNFPMEMNAHQVPDVAALMTKMTTLVETRETQRVRRERSRERTPPRTEERPRKKTPPPPSKDVHSGSEEGEIEED